MELNPMTHETHSQGFENVANDMLVCIQNCTHCSQICQHLIQHCLQLGAKHADPVHISLLQDCADICTLAANFMLRESSLHHRACAVCAEVCEECALNCEGFSDDAVMQSCAEMCRRCMDSCQQMSLSH